MRAQFAEAQPSEDERETSRESAEEQQLGRAPHTLEQELAEDIEEQQRLLSSGTVAQHRLARLISKGRRSHRRIRVGLGVATLLLGLIAGVAFEVTHLQLIEEARVSICMTEPYLYVLWLAHEVLLYWRVVLLMLAPLADDLRFTRCVLVLDALVLCISYISVWSTGAGQDISYKMKSTSAHRALHIHLLLNLVCMLGLLVCMGFSNVRLMQEYAWLVIACWLALSALTGSFWTFQSFYYCGTITADVFIVPTQLATLYFVRTPRLREGLQTTLQRLFESHSSSRAAAGIAGLVGECSTRKLLKSSGSRFRGIRLADMVFEDIADNTPRPDLFERTIGLKLNDSDAFISHSWHDPPQTKWAALQRWRWRFVSEHGREPVVWFDKFCIDQNNIDESLCCLPVFLSGCQRLVVFCGTTYLNRLWCVMELFTFVHIGRDLQQIEFHHVEDEEFGPVRSREKIDSSFRNFDAIHCDCFNSDDKVKMLSIVHAAFGSLHAFNACVCDIFRSVGLHNEASQTEGDSVSDGSASGTA